MLNKLFKYIELFLIKSYKFGMRLPHSKKQISGGYTSNIFKVFKKTIMLKGSTMPKFVLKDKSEAFEEVCAQFSEAQPLTDEQEIFDYFTSPDDDDARLIARLRTLDNFKASSMTRGGKKVMR